MPIILLTRCYLRDITSNRFLKLFIKPEFLKAQHSDFFFKNALDCQLKLLSKGLKHIQIMLVSQKVCC